jgi:hypothetical protein
MSTLRNSAMPPATGGQPDQRQSCRGAVSLPVRTALVPPGTGANALEHLRNGLERGWMNAEDSHVLGRGFAPACSTRCWAVASVEPRQPPPG